MYDKTKNNGSITIRVKKGYVDIKTEGELDNDFIAATLGALYADSIRKLNLSDVTKVRLIDAFMEQIDFFERS